MRGARQPRLRAYRMVCAGALGIALLAACSSPGLTQTVAGGAAGSYVVPQGIHKIKHVIIVMQENRSFDSYFGTYPGADGIPMQNGVPTVCVPDPRSHRCLRPFHDRNDLNYGGPHGMRNARLDIHGGRMR